MLKNLYLTRNQHSHYSITLCICTMNRPKDLESCLQSVLQSALECEVAVDEILVSDDSADPIPNLEVIRRYPSITYQAGPRRGLAPNRNACLRVAKGSHIMFIDDDVIVPSNFFEIAYQKLSLYPEKTIITGYEMKHEMGTVHKVVPLNADFWGLQQLPVQDKYRSIVINATIFPASLFKLAQFDEYLRYGSEEIDIAQHAIAVGYNIEAVDDLYLDHYPSLINREDYRKFLDASRLYVTAKAYWEYEKSVLKTMLFMVLAPLQLLAYTIKRLKFSETKQGVKAIHLAYNYWCSYLKSKQKHSGQLL